MLVVAVINLVGHCFALRCRAARKLRRAARLAAFRASTVSGSSSLESSSWSARKVVTPGIHDLKEFKIAEKFFRIELSSIVKWGYRAVGPNCYLYFFVSLLHFCPWKKGTLIFLFKVLVVLGVGGTSFKKGLNTLFTSDLMTWLNLYPKVSLSLWGEKITWFGSSTWSVAVLGILFLVICATILFLILSILSLKRAKYPVCTSSVRLCPNFESCKFCHLARSWPYYLSTQRAYTYIISDKMATFWSLLWEANETSDSLLYIIGYQRGYTLVSYIKYDTVLIRNKAQQLVSFALQITMWLIGLAFSR